MSVATPIESATCWEFDPAWTDVVDELRRHAPADWERLPGVSVVKSGPHRVVYRLDRAERSLFVKHYRAATWRSLARSLLRPSAARREWRKTTEMARRGVPTVRPVAWGEDRRAGVARDAFFASEAIDGAIALDEYLRDFWPKLPSGERARTRVHLARQLAQLVARSHRAGVWHDDFHAGNILLSNVGACTRGDGRGDATEWLMHLIDVPGVTIQRRALGWRRTRTSLAMLCSGLLWQASRTDRLRFFRAYLAERPELRLADPNRAAAEVIDAAHRHARRVFRRRDARAWAANRDFYAQRLRSGRAHAVRGLAADELRRVFDSPAAFLREHLDRPTKLSHTSVVVEASLVVDERDTPVALKRCRAKSWSKNWLAWWRGTRARVAWQRGQALVARRIATARPLAMVEARRGLATREGYVLTEWIDGATNLHLYGWDLARRDPLERRQRIRQLAESLGRLVGQLHVWRLSHRDLKGCNLLAVERENDVAAALIDLDGLRVRRWLSRRARWRDLARLEASARAHGWVSRGDRLRWLRAYFRAQETPACSADWKRWWREIDRRASRIARRLHARGEPLA